jgi:hypothetical protein
MIPTLFESLAPDTMPAGVDVTFRAVVPALTFVFIFMTVLAKIEFHLNVLDILLTLGIAERFVAILAGYIAVFTEESEP